MSGLHEHLCRACANSMQASVLLQLLKVNRRYGYGLPTLPRPLRQAIHPRDRPRYAEENPVNRRAGFRRKEATANI